MNIVGYLTDVAKRVRNPQRTVRHPIICMYHSVTKKATRDWGPWQYAVTPTTFEEQIRWLSKNKTIVPINDLIGYISEDRSLPKNAVIITFDDGYQDYVDQAVPVLDTFEAPSTVYVSTQLMHDQVAPYEYRLAAALEQSDSATVEIDGKLTKYDLSTEEDVKRAYAELRLSVKGSTVEKRNALIEQIGATDVKEFRIVTPEMVAEMGSHPLVTVGSHGHAHRPLGQLPDDVVRKNMKTSKDNLSVILKDQVTHFAFPYGSCSEFTFRTAQHVGYESAVTTESRPVNPRDWNQCYRLPRIDMSSLDFKFPIY